MIFREENVILKVQQLRLYRPVHTNDLKPSALIKGLNHYSFLPWTDVI